jgi:hypothetical protein
VLEKCSHFSINLYPLWILQVVWAFMSQFFFLPFSYIFGNLWLNYHSMTHFCNHIVFVATFVLNIMFILIDWCFVRVNHAWIAVKCEGVIVSRFHWCEHKIWLCNPQLIRTNYTKLSHAFFFYMQMLVVYLLRIKLWINYVKLLRCPNTYH